MTELARMAAAAARAAADQHFASLDSDLARLLSAVRQKMAVDRDATTVTAWATLVLLAEPAGQPEFTAQLLARLLVNTVRAESSEPG